MTPMPVAPSCNPHGDPPVFGDCWYNCTSDDISGDDKQRRLRKVCSLHFLYVIFSHLVGEVLSLVTACFDFGKTNNLCILLLVKLLYKISKQ